MVEDMAGTGVRHRHATTMAMIAVRHHPRATPTHHGTPTLPPGAGATIAAVMAVIAMVLVAMGKFLFNL